MCGRYFIDPGESKKIRDIVEEIQRSSPEQVKIGEIFPTYYAPILYGKSGMLIPQAAVWGFKGFKGKNVIINARAETAPEKPMFRESLFTRRCLVPTTGFYEWDRDKRKYLFRLPQNKALYLAGLYRDYEDGRRFAILTGSANDSISDVHHRMPIVLPPEIKDDWVADTDFALRYLSNELPALERRLV